MNDSDVTLVARIAARDDRTAFELLVRRHEAPLRNFLRRLARNDFARADDLAQETFIRIYRSIGSFKGASSFKTWLYRIAYNAFVDDERKRFVGAELSEADHPRDSDFADRTDAELDVAAALQNLSVRQQAVFDLYYKKGMSQSELAEALDMPIGTVKSDLVRGHARLKEILQRRGYDNGKSN